MRSGAQSLSGAWTPYAIMHTWPRTHVCASTWPICVHVLIHLCREQVVQHFAHGYGEDLETLKSAFELLHGAQHYAFSLKRLPVVLPTCRGFHVGLGVTTSHHCLSVLLLCVCLSVCAHLCLSVLICAYLCMCLQPSD